MNYRLALSIPSIPRSFLYSFRFSMVVLNFRISTIWRMGSKYLSDWKQVDDGIEVCEFRYAHLDAAWRGERRYVVVRQEKKRPKAVCKQLSLFESEPYGNDYRHSLYVTNNQTASHYEIWGY